MRSTPPPTSRRLARSFGLAIFAAATSGWAAGLFVIAVDPSPLPLLLTTACSFLALGGLASWLEQRRTA